MERLASVFSPLHHREPVHFLHHLSITLSSHFEEYVGHQRLCLKEISQGPLYICLPDDEFEAGGDGTDGAQFDEHHSPASIVVSQSAVRRHWPVFDDLREISLHPSLYVHLESLDCRRRLLRPLYDSGEGAEEPEIVSHV